jgi:hypothetical protein
MTENNDWIEAPGGLNGHAAIGFLMGIRDSEGRRPPTLTIEYIPRGSEEDVQRTRVRRDSTQPRVVERNSSVSYIKLWMPEGDLVKVDRIIRAKAHEDD